MALLQTDKARFVQPTSGARLSNLKITLATGNTVEIGVSFKKSTLPSFSNAGVQVAEDGGSKFVGRVLFPLSRFKDDLTIYRVKGASPGPARLLLFEGANILDNVEFNVVGRELSGITILRALDQKTIEVNPADEAVLRNAIKGSKTVIVDDQILDLIAALSRIGKLGIMSLLRRGHGQHGVEVGDKVFVKAVDFHIFNGKDIISSGKQSLVDLICDMLKAFPESDFDLGFPRPKAPPKDFDPPNDVFFSVPDAATAQLCEDNKISRTLQQMLSPAKEKVAAAMSTSKASFHVLYPDGLNHLHVAVTRTPNTKVNLSV